MPKALVVPAGVFEPVTLIDLEPSLQVLQGHVDGYIEFLAVDGAEFCVNEDGKVIGLPINARATNCLYQLAPEFINHDFLVGTVLILGASDGEDSFADVTPQAMKCFGL